MICSWDEKQMQTANYMHSSTSFYIRDLSICRCWYLWRVLKPIPCSYWGTIAVSFGGVKSYTEIFDSQGSAPQPQCYSSIKFISQNQVPLRLQPLLDPRSNPLKMLTDCDMFWLLTLIWWQKTCGLDLHPSSVKSVEVLVHSQKKSPIHSQLTRRTGWHTSSIGQASSSFIKGTDLLVELKCPEGSCSDRACSQGSSCHWGLTYFLP